MAVYWLEEVNRKAHICDTKEQAIVTIKKLYRRGMPPREIIELFKMWTSAPTILKMLKIEGVEIRARGGQNKINIDITEEQYTNLSFMAIGKLYNVTAPTVKKEVEANPNKYKHLTRNVRKEAKMRWSDNG